MQVRLGLAQKGRLRPAVCACGRALRSSGNLRTALLYSCTPRPSDAPTMVLVAGICARLPGTPDARKCKTRCRAAQQVRRRRRSRETRRGAQDGGINSVHGSALSGTLWTEHDLHTSTHIRTVLTCIRPVQRCCFEQQEEMQPQTLAHDSACRCTAPA